MVGEGAELLYHFLVLVGVFVGTDIYPLVAEHRIIAFEIFFE